MKHLSRVSIYIILVYVLMACQFLPGQESESPQEMTNLPQANEGENSEESADVFTGTYFDLLARGNSVVCEWQTSSDGQDISGTTYVSGERLRSEANMTIDGENTTVYSLFDANDIYSWFSNSNMGTKFTKSVIEEVEVEEMLESESNAPIQDYNQEVDFNCQSWQVDESLLTPPEDISFQDMSGLLQQYQGSGETLQVPSAENACDYCQQVPAGAARDACLANC